MALLKKHEMDFKGWQKTLLLIAILLLAFLLLMFVIQRAFEDNTPGIDFYVYWQAGRAFFFEGQDPYSQEVSERIQSGIYHGRQALPGEDPMKFNYPPFALLPVFPFLFLPFNWAQAAWMAFNLIGISVGLSFSFRKVPLWIVLLLPFYYQSVFGLVLGNLTILIFIILLWVTAQFTEDRPQTHAMQITLGVLLAWVSVKPQLVWLFVLLFLLVSLQRKQYWIPGSYLGALGVLSASMFLIRGDWLSGWLQHLKGFTQFHPSAPCRQFFLELLLPVGALPAASWVLQAVVLILMAGVFVLWLRKKLPWLVLMSWGSLTVMVFHPVCISYDQLILLLPLVIWGVDRASLRLTRLAVWVAGLVLSYAFLVLSAWQGEKWIVNQMPIVVYLVWMLWLHVWWLPRNRPERYAG